MVWPFTVLFFPPVGDSLVTNSCANSALPHSKTLFIIREQLQLVATFGSALVYVCAQENYCEAFILDRFLVSVCLLWLWGCPLHITFRQGQVRGKEGGAGLVGVGGGGEVVVGATCGRTPEQWLGRQSVENIYCWVLPSLTHAMQKQC